MRAQHPVAALVSQRAAFVVARTAPTPEFRSSANSFVVVTLTAHRSGRGMTHAFDKLAFGGRQQLCSVVQEEARA